MVDSARQDELKKEIEAIEANAEASDVDLQRLEELKTELAKIELVGGDENESGLGVQYRALTEAEFRKLKEFTSRYPGFSSLPIENKLDRVCLILTQGFGFGSFNLNLVIQAARAIGVEIPQNFEAYLRDSIDPVISQNKFVDVGGGSFKVNRLFAQNLIDGKSRTSNSAKVEEPIRKKSVEAKPSVVQPVRVTAPAKPSVQQPTKAKLERSVPQQVKLVEEVPVESLVPVAFNKKKAILVSISILSVLAIIYFLIK